MNLLPLITLQIVHANSQILKQNTAWFATQAVNSMKESVIGPCLPTAQKLTTIQVNVSSANRNISIIRQQRNVFTQSQVSVILMMEEGNASSVSKTIFLHQGYAFALALYQNLITVTQMIKGVTVWFA